MIFVLKLCYLSFNPLPLLLLVQKNDYYNYRLATTKLILIKREKLVLTFFGGKLNYVSLHSPVVVLYYSRAKEL